MSLSFVRSKIKSAVKIYFAESMKPSARINIAFQAKTVVQSCTVLTGAFATGSLCFSVTFYNAEAMRVVIANAV